MERVQIQLAGTAAKAVVCYSVPRTYYSYYYFHLLKRFNFISTIIRLTDYPAPQHRDLKQVRALKRRMECWQGDSARATERRSQAGRE